MRLQIDCEDRLGITQDILDILRRYDIDLRGIEIDETGKIFLDFPTIEFENFQHLMPQIRRLAGISDVKTTPFMPIQRERNQLRAIISSLPDPCFSIDMQGKIILFNQAVKDGLELDSVDILQLHIEDVLKGFNFSRFLAAKRAHSVAHKVKFLEQDFIADVLPVEVPDSDKTVRAGAVVLLKSEFRLGAQVSAFNQAAANSFSFFQANSSNMKKCIKEARRLAILDDNLLIFGEVGSGKQEMAKACHQASPRAKYPLMSISFASLSEEQAHLQIFGSEDQKGILAEGQRGTILLDDISNMPYSLQSRLVGIVERESRLSSIPEYDLRFIATTSQDLAELTEQGRFRYDLYLSLSRLAMRVPPLRERKADIIPMAERLLNQQSDQLGVACPKLAKSCVDYLQKYPWPGNIKQLRNALYRAISVSAGKDITIDDIQLPHTASTLSVIDEDFDGSLEQEVKKFEKSLLKKLYPNYPSTRQLAKKLGLSHTAIANKLREYGISKATVKY